MKRILIKNARIVNENEVFNGSVIIENEIISEILRDGKEPLATCDD